MSDNSAPIHPTSWYSRRRPNDGNFTSTQDFSPAFWREVYAIRQKFHLVNTAFGIDQTQGGPDCWQPYELTDPSLGLNRELVSVAVSRFEWSHIQPSQNETGQPLVPRMRLRMHLARPITDSKATSKKGRSRPRPPSNLTLPPGYTVFHSCWVTVEFNSKHPLSSPSLYIGGRPPGADAHEHHWFSGGRLCIFFTNQGWEKQGRSTTKWIGLAVAWATWHVREFGY